MSTYIQPTMPAGVRFTTQTVTIANNASLSGAVDLETKTLIAINMPGTWTSADITLQASADNSTWVNVFDAADNEIAIKAAASRWIRLNPNDYLSIRYLKVRSGTSGTPVNQGGARTITLVLRAI